MTNLVETLRADLLVESEQLCRALETLDEAAWMTPTSGPSTIKGKVAHLAWNDEAALRALTQPEEFLATKPTTTQGIQLMFDQVIVDHGNRPGVDLLAWMRTARDGLLDASAGLDPRKRMPWYGPEMSLASKLTAQFMETWAHGRDIFDALHIRVTPTDRVRHVVFLGLQTIPNSYVANGLEPPNRPVRLELFSPSGHRWDLGSGEATNVVRGSAVELAHVVTQRRRFEDTDLIAEGAVANQWLSIAQAFAGPPGTGRTSDSR